MKKRAFLSLLTVLFVVTACLGTVSASAKSEKAAVSPGLFVIAADNGMAKAGIKGKTLSLDRDDFARALNLRGISSITVTKAPAREEGKLTVGTTVVQDGHTVSGSNISLLTFCAASESVTKSSFKFRPEGAAYELECSLYLLDKVNYAPTLNLASSATLKVSTYENVRHFGKLTAYDPDGDECIYEVVSYPEKGTLVMADKNSGEYVYTPDANYVGKDSFTYVAKDKYGNYSASATVSLNVSRSSMSVTFDDMKNSSAHSAAITLTEEGIMSGTQVGEGYYFQPDKAVSRSEFVVMAMRALGIKEVSGVSKTEFYDDGDIPTAMKDYVAAAHELEYVTGSYVDGKLCFLPNEEISRAEAAVIVCRMIDAATPTLKPEFDDAEDIPTWASGALYSSVSAGLLETVDGEIRAEDAISRADTAKMLCAMLELKK